MVSNIPLFIRKYHRVKVSGGTQVSFSKCKPRTCVVRPNIRLAHTPLAVEPSFVQTARNSGTRDVDTRPGLENFFCRQPTIRLALPYPHAHAVRLG